MIEISTSIKQTGLFDLFSSYNKLLRVTALILRFVNNCKRKSQRQIDFLTTIELQNAHRMLVRKTQHETYAAEIGTLASKNQLPSGNKLASLTQFLDNYENMRVDGRLENASISYDQKHPYILHMNNTITQLIFQHYHTKHLHAGNRQLQYLLGLKYWIPGVSQVIRRTIY